MKEKMWFPTIANIPEGHYLFPSMKVDWFCESIEGSCVKARWAYFLLFIPWKITRKFPSFKFYTNNPRTRWLARILSEIQYHREKYQAWLFWVETFRRGRKTNPTGSMNLEKYLRAKNKV